MKYNLLQNNRGILIDRTPIITDVKGSPALSFLLPGEGEYYAVLTNGTGVALKCKIQNDGECPLRCRDLLVKRQYYDLTVTQLNDNGEVVQAWTCEPLLVSSLTFALKSQWQISGGMTDEAAIKRIAELEVVNDAMLLEMAEIKAEMSVMRTNIEKRMRRAVR